MNGLNPEFKLAKLDLPEEVLEQIERVRLESLPTIPQLVTLQKQADQSRITEIDEHDLTFIPKGHSNLFRLEYKASGTQTGAIGFNAHRPKQYRLLWLLDGRTIETVQVGRSESYLIYADGMEIGSFDVTDTRRELFFLKMPCEWSVEIGNTKVIKMYLPRSKPVQIYLDFPNNPSLKRWTGRPKAPDATVSLFSLLKLVLPKKETPSNTNWFLPRDELGSPIVESTEELLALMSFSTLTRHAFDDMNS